MSSVLVTGARAFAALDWVRRFGRAGHRVTACDSFQHPLCRSSRYLSHYTEVPPSRQSPVEHALAVRDAALACEAEWIIPTCEEIFALARYRRLFDGVSKLLAPSFESLGLLHHKGHFATWVDSLPALSIRAPETRELRSREDVAAFLASEGDPRDWVLKPAFSRFASEVLIRPSAGQAGSITPTAEHPWLAQRFVPGRPLCTFTLAIEGRITAHSTYEPRHRSGQGAGFFFEPVEAPELFEFCSRLVGHLNFTGQICFDFIAGPEGPRVIECNPRTTSGIHLLAPEDPLPFLNAGCGRLWPVDPTPRMITFAMVTEPGRSLNRWTDLMRGRDVVKPPDDRLTHVAGWQMFKELRQREKMLGPGADMKAASTFDLEWNGEPLPELPA
ncbi:ATP-grasp domain-containing protein [Luteolibacter ambystomatis]|uniref:ATP-grasp domain-containing protein n=1 Tax=Luteolibacter ambystomatis TaxID=2824561 RepID=A0A975IYN3_9BACT|nr:ATP-grasp domain-containing protein [Luteolibacter ambystomatis]QUE50068.1 ATP-grasp domain-containing protein [Luteolibacter ambystomatis]